MDLTHELVTDKIKDEIRKLVKDRMRLPGYTLAVFKDHVPMLLRFEEVDNVITDKNTAEIVVRFCGYKLKEDQVEDYLNWFSGAIFGFLIGRNNMKDKEVVDV